MKLKIGYRDLRWNKQLVSALVPQKCQKTHAKVGMQPQYEIFKNTIKR